MRTLCLLVALLWLAPELARAAEDEAPVAAPVAPVAVDPALTQELAALEQLHAAALADKRRLMHAVLGAGIVSVVGGGAMMITDADDLAYRVAGGCALAFGAIDAVIAVTALVGINRQARAWDADREGRGNPGGLLRARARWAAAERGEGVSFALNLGLDVAYLTGGLVAVTASQLGVDHPDRWLAGGLSVAVQALLLTGIDVAGLTKSGRLHQRLLRELVPGIALTGALSEPGVRLTMAGRF